MKFMKSLSIIMIFALSTAVLAHNKDKGSNLQDVKLEAKIWAKYAMHEEMNPFEIDVDVDHGRVTLAGTVDTNAEAKLAEVLISDMKGVESIQNDLKVEGREKPKDVATFVDQKVVEPLSDAAKTSMIQTKLLWNRDVSGWDIDVDTEGDEVTLTGVVHSQKACDTAEYLALDTPGVKTVNNDIKVEYKENTLKQRVDSRLEAFEDGVSDAWLTTKIKSRLLWSTNVEGDDINVDVNDGHVILKGHVPNSAQKHLAVEMTSKMVGVKKVEDHIEVK